MTNKFNYTTRIIVIVAILGLLLGLILGGVFSIIDEYEEDDSDEIYNLDYRYKIIEAPTPLAEICYNSCCKNCNLEPVPNPWRIVYPIKENKSPL